MKRTAQSIEAKKSSEGTRPKKPRKTHKMHPNSIKNLKPAPPWKKGVSANPGGLPGTDLAAVYARRLFEEHPEGITDELGDRLKGFNAYAYSVLADRGYGKVKEVQQVEHTGELAISIKMVKTNGT